MVDAIGRGYVVQYCISLYRKKMEKFAFQSYISDVLCTLNNNFARQLGGTEISMRYVDLVKPFGYGSQTEPQDDRTGDEIAADIILRAGLSFGGKEETEAPDG